MFRLEEDRYARHRLIDGWDQERLAAARFVVVGAGAVGNEVLKLLAMAGARHLTVVDPDRVERTNLTRTVLFRDSDVGRPKAVVAAERLPDLNPEAEVRAVVGFCQTHLSLLECMEADLLLGCLDNVEARLELNRMAWLAGVPWLDSGISEDAASVAFYEPGGPCYQCQMTPETWERVGRRYSCTGLQSAAPERPAGTTATMATLAAGLQVAEALKWLFGARHALGPGERMVLGTAPPSLQVFRTERDPGCLAHEEPIRLGPRVCVDAGVPCGEVLARCGFRDPEDGLELRATFLVGLRCHGCGRSEAVVRPARQTDVTVLPCPSCGEGREAVTASRVRAGDPHPIGALVPAGRDALPIRPASGSGPVWAAISIQGREIPCPTR